MSDVQQAQQRILKGTVTSDRMKDTVVVRVDSFKMHRLYGKQYKVSRKYKAHDPKNSFKIGDKVSIRQVRPISKDKRWLVIYAKQEKTV